MEERQKRKIQNTEYCIDCGALTVPGSQYCAHCAAAHPKPQWQTNNWGFGMRQEGSRYWVPWAIIGVLVAILLIWFLIYLVNYIMHI